MTTINTSHTLRLTVRIELFDASTSIDLTIPTSSSLAEIIDEILAIANLPTNPAPWCATTVAGQELDPTIPLAQCHLTQGDILVISPITEPRLSGMRQNSWKTSPRPPHHQSAQSSAPDWPDY